ncbi:MAG: hypothetical protein Fur0014_02600 [Rubrivivax sp.]
MVHVDHTVWLQSAPPSGCGGCGPEAGGCGGAPLGRPCDQPELEGDPALLARLLRALREVADAAGNLVDAHRFSALRLHDGEAELVLSFPRGCGSLKLLAEGAFQVLRRELPDTDVYVRHLS